MKRIILIDGHSVIFRSYYAFIRNPLRNSKGFNTSAIFGFINTLKKIEKNLGSDYIAVAFDTGEKTFRHEKFEGYKATRKPPPDDLSPQIPIIKEMLQAMGIRIFELEGYEADDLLATLGKRLADKGEVYIVSSDKDLLQIVGGNIYVFDPYREIIYDEKMVKEKFGVEPKRIVDLLAIAGDVSDNVPGIPGYGLKKARLLLQSYQDIDLALKSDEKLSGYQDAVNFYRSLLAVEEDVPIDADLDDLKRSEMNSRNLVRIFKEMEFYQFLKELVSAREPGDYKEGKGRLIPGSYGIFVDDRFYISKEKGKARAFQVFKENLRSITKSEVSAFSIKDLIRKTGVVPEVYFDVGLTARLINPDQKINYENLILEYLGIPVENLTPYMMADYALRLKKDLKDRIEDLKLKEVFELEHNLIPIIADMERRGIRVDIKRVAMIRNEIEKELATLKNEIYQLAGRSFNINSSRQLSHILFDVLDLKPTKRKKTGYSTDSSVLTELCKYHKLPEKVLVYREKAKLLSTYLDPIFTRLGKKDGRIHTTFHQLGAATGRLSSTDPNLQNIPQALKEIFVSEPGYKFISADYSQIELRILAYLSGDNGLINSFSRGDDIHNQTASEIFNIPKQEIQEHHRRVAKMVNYGLIYGLSSYGLSEGLGISKDEAQLIVDRHKDLYPDVQTWIENHIEKVKHEHETRTIIGRRRVFLPPITEPKIRAAINSPIQGSAADLIKMAMVKIENRLKELDINGGIIVQVHDELLLEIEEKKVDTAIKVVSEEMERVYPLSVDLAVHIGVGDDWKEAH